MKFFTRNAFRLIVSAAVAFSSVPIAVSSAADPKPSAVADGTRIVALGDSVSVGFEPTEAIKNGTAAPYGYVDRIMEQSLFRDRTELENYAVMGLTTLGLVNLLQGAEDGKPLSAKDLQDFSSYDPRVAAQADAVAKRTKELASDLSQADLVVLTIGGNDFSSLIKTAVQAKSIESARQIIQDSFQKTMNNYTEDLEKMITRLHDLAPGAQIVIADQYLPLFKGHELYPLLSEKVGDLSDALDLFAKRMLGLGVPIKIAHVSGKFLGKESEWTYFNMWDGYDIHPKQAGYEALAQSFAETIWSDGYLKTKPRAAGTPMSVVINGKEPPSKPVVVNNTTFLALRDVADAVGADLKWNQKTKTAVFAKDGNEVAVTIGAKTIVVNGETKPLATPAYFQQDGKLQKTYVPLAVISEGLNFQVVFRKPILTAFIRS